MHCCSGVAGIFAGHMQPNTTVFQTLMSMFTDTEILHQHQHRRVSCAQGGCDDIVVLSCLWRDAA